jgi:hypothetical protein
MRPLPPRDYSLVVPAGQGQADIALAVLHEGMMRALAQSHLLPAGFPQRGTVVQTPSTAEAGVVNVSCSAPQGEARRSEREHQAGADVEGAAGASAR